MPDTLGGRTATGMIAGMLVAGICIHTNSCCEECAGCWKGSTAAVATDGAGTEGGTVNASGAVSGIVL